MNFKIRAILCVTLLGIASGCSSIVRHPEIDGVKRVAIVSVTLAREFKNLNGRSDSGAAQVGAYGGLLKKGLASVQGEEKKEKEKVNPEEEDNRIRIAQYALETYTANLKKVPNWEIVPLDQFMGSDEYKTLIKLGPSGAMTSKSADSGFLKTMSDLGSDLKYATPKNMAALPLESENLNSEKEELLQKLMKKYNLHGVASVDVQVFHDPAWPGIYTTPMAAGSIQMLNAKNEKAIVFPKAKDCKRYMAPEKVITIGGAMLPTKEVEHLLHVAIEGTAKHTAAVIAKGIQEK